MLTRKPGINFTAFQERVLLAIYQAEKRGNATDTNSLAEHLNSSVPEIEEALSVLQSVGFAERY